MITYGIGTYAGVMVVITGDISDVPTASENATAVLAAAATTPIQAVTPAELVTEIADAVWNKTLP